MNNLDISALLERANSVLSSVTREFASTFSGRENSTSTADLTVSSGVESEIHEIDRVLQGLSGVSTSNEEHNETADSDIVELQEPETNLLLLEHEPSRLVTAAHDSDEEFNGSLDSNMLAELERELSPIPFPQQSSRRISSRRISSRRSQPSITQEQPRRIISRQLHSENSSETTTPLLPRRNTNSVPEIIDLCNTPREVEIIDLVSPPASKTRRRTAPEGSCNNGSSPPKQSRTEPDMICAICMENYLKREPTATKCGHIFCSSCILQIVRGDSKCPLCRTRISRKTLTPLYF